MVVAVRAEAEVAPPAVVREVAELEVAELEAVTLRPLDQPMVQPTGMIA